MIGTSELNWKLGELNWKLGRFKVPHDCHSNDSVGKDAIGCRLQFNVRTMVR